MRHETINISDAWEVTEAAPALQAGTAHTWLASLNLPDPAFQECSSFLSPDEKDRAARFRSQEHQRHYAAGRGLLRKLLGGYLQVKPSSLVFAYNRNGKPLLNHLYPGFSFNVSHSYGWALFGFTLGTELGVDIEKERPDFATMEIAERFFAPDEVDVLRSLPPPIRSTAFFSCWTRKEAFIKAHGKGLSMGLDKFVVAFAPGVRPGILHSEIEADAATQWSIVDLPVPPGFKGALAVKAAPVALRRFTPQFSRATP